MGHKERKIRLVIFTPSSVNGLRSESVCAGISVRCSRNLAEKGGSRTLREPYGPQTGFEDQRHHRAPSFSVYKANWLACMLSSVKTAVS